MSYTRIIECLRAKPAWCEYFVAIFRVAQSPLKFGMATLFVLKKVCFFFQECRKICPSPNNAGFRFLSAKTLCLCLLHCEKCRERGGLLSRTSLKPCYPACGNKNAGAFFHRKGVGMTNFSGFWATWAALHRALQLAVSVRRRPVILEI